MLERLFEFVPEIIIACVFLVVGVVMIWFVVRFISVLTGMNERYGERQTGALEQKFGWGSGKIRAMVFKHSLKAYGYKKGLELKTIWVLGGGKRFFKKKSINIICYRPGGWLIRPQLELKVEGVEILLWGRYARRIHDWLT